MTQLTMRNTIVGIAACTALSCSTAKKASTPEPSIIWQANPVVIDGMNNDWSLPYTYMDSKAKIEYAFSNDKENLYITMKSSDRMTQMKILNAGMNVWIDLSGKKNKSTSVSFPLESTEPMKMPGRDNANTDHPSSEQPPRAAQVLKKAVENAHDYSLHGFQGCDGSYLVKQNNSCGIETKIGLDGTDELVWEAKVPFKSFYKETIGQEDVAKTISICFEINALKKPDMSPSTSDRSSGMGRGMGGGGMHGGGMRGGMGGGMGRGNMPQDRTQLFETTTCWEKIHLAGSAH